MNEKLKAVAEEITRIDVPEYLVNNTRRISEARAREIHPKLFSRLEA